jgi:hypothetical protein
MLPNVRGWREPDSTHVDRSIATHTAEAAPKLITKWMDAMQLSERLSTATVSVSPQGRKAMSAKVLSLSREGIRASVRVDPGVIKILADFLNEAIAGEVIAGAIVWVRPNATICSAISAPHGGRHHLVAACDYLKQDIIAETDN